MTGSINTMVKAVREARTMQVLASVGKWRRKVAAATPVLPLEREQRVSNYAKQTGWTSDFTPRQRRRLLHKENRAMRPLKAGRNGILLTEVDEGLQP